MTYDAIVVGTGGVGSAALYHLARRGARVIGLDRFPPAHDRGSSHGQTRIIRQAYHEHPNYVPLLLRAYDLWRELEQVIDKKLLYEVGLLFGGPSDDEIIAGVELASKKYHLPIERLSIGEAATRWPGFCLPDSFRLVFEKQAGYLLVEDCVRAHIDAAIRAGASLRCGPSVLGWKISGTGVAVETDEGTLHANRIAIAAGAWASDFLASINVPFQVLRKPLFWYANCDPLYNVESGCPCFFFDTMGGQFYGFPRSGPSGVKIAEHTGGTPVANPLNVDRTLHTEERDRVESCLTEHLPGVARECTAHAVCMYTMSPDEHFIVGRHPELPQIVFAAGLSGHGFKFTSVLGEIMAKLAMDEESELDIEFLSAARFNCSNL
jgi:sarcosine oxidase